MKEKRAAGTFQLTPSRRATDEAGYLVMLPGISTHALTEGDVNGGSSMRSGYRFQLTPSRRATVQNFALVRVRCISTHALTEGD